MTTLHVYSNRHIQNQVCSFEKGDWVFLENALSRKRWALYLKVNNIQEKDLDITYLTKEEFFALTEIKFDNIVGNPPYQNPNAKHVKLWLDILEKSLTLLKDENSTLSFVTPDVWVQDINKVATQARELLSKKTVKMIDMDADNHFNVGESLCHFIVENKENTTNELTKIKNNNTTQDILFDGHPLVFSANRKIEMSIFKKMTDDKFPKTVLNRVDGNGTVCMGHKEDVQSESHSTLVYFSYKDSFWTDLDFSEFQKPKLIFNNSGYYFKEGKDYIRKAELEVAGNNAHQLMLSSMKEVDNAFNVYTSKLYRFFVNTFKTGGFNCTTIRKLPTVDFSRKWTDIELYDYFDLSDKEREYVEANYV